MTDKQVMQQALAALEDERYVTKYTHIVDVITALRKALEQPQQEPVAWQYKTVEANIFVSEHRPVDVSVWQEIEWSKPLYTTPPAAQRKWVGLTDDEAKEIYSCIHGYDSDKRIARAIEAKLKERNT